MNCQNCRKIFETNSKFQEILSKLNLPLPTFCPSCRLVRRMTYRNERALYKRKCSAEGHSEEVISVFSPEKPDRIYCQKSWWGDSWDGLTYGREYDFSKPFFPQLRELWKEVPDMALLNINPVNSDYCSITEGNKNCYLVIGGDFNENTSYSAFVYYCKDVVDCFWLKKCEFCYETSESFSCSNILYSRFCESSFDSAFLFNCKNCHHCFGCANLKNASYQIFNEQYTKEEYEKKIKEFGIESYATREEMKIKYESFIKKFPRKFARILSSINSTGDNIEHAKNVTESFDVFDGAEDSTHLWYTYSQIKDSSDLDHSGRQTELSYECSTLYPASRVFFSRFIFSGHDIEYSYNCHNSSYLFGCIGLKNKQYCIFNKQYTKEEYETLIPKIKTQMNELPYINSQGIIYKYGEFFPTELSPFAYNETVAQELEPLSKETILARELTFQEQGTKDYTITKKYSDIPQKISDTDESIIKEIISCSHEGKCTHGCATAFRLTKEELEFYTRMNIPVPHLCSNCRHYERTAYRNPLMLWERKCDCTGKKSKNEQYTNTVPHSHGDATCAEKFQTSYSPERTEIIYCESCYQHEIA